MALEGKSVLSVLLHIITTGILHNSNAGHILLSNAGSGQQVSPKTMLGWRGPGRVG